MRRLREMSLFECDVRVLRNGFCKCVPPLSWPSSFLPSCLRRKPNKRTPWPRNAFWHCTLIFYLTLCPGRSVPSQELVPGDVFEFSDPSLNEVPCDCLLLSGDCIVNESMLTGLCSHLVQSECRKFWPETRWICTCIKVSIDRWCIQISWFKCPICPSWCCQTLSFQWNKGHSSSSPAKCRWRWRDCIGNCSKNWISDNQRRADSLHAFSKTIWVQILPRFFSLYICHGFRRCPGLRGIVYQLP